MSLRQLECLCTVIDEGLSITRAANALGTSQPSVSREIRLLEDRLGVTVLKRSRKRIVGITKAGEEVLDVARRMLRDADNLNRIGKDYGGKKGGVLSMAVSHTQAAYALPRIIPQFAQKHPNVRLTLRQGNPTQIARWLSDGEVDFSIATEPAKPVPDIVLLPIYTLHRVILTPLAHPLLAQPKPTLEMLARYRLITYGEEFSYYSRIMQTFKEKGLTPDVVLTATDVDVMKKYVKLGLGIAIITSLAYDPKDDEGLGAVDVSHLFEGSCVKLGLRQNTYLSSYAYEFLRVFAPHLDSTAIRDAITAPSRSARASVSPDTEEHND